MKKQLLIAAVAATMGTAAIADISITGGAKVNYVYTESGTASTTTNAINHDMDLDIVGKSGDTTVNIHLGGIEGASGTDDLATENVTLATKIGDVSLKTGTWDNGDNQLRSSTRSTGKVSVSSTFEGVTVAFDDAQDSNATLKLSGSVSGIDAYYKRGTTIDDFGLNGTFGGVSFDYDAMGSDDANNDRDSLVISTVVSGITLTYAAANADSSATINGDSWLGDFEGNTTGAMALDAGDDVSGFGAKMALAGNTVQLKSVTIDEASGTDGADITKLVVTRALSNGTTFEAIWTDLDAEVNSEDKTTLDLELAVKF